jgi:hypothetical protein
VAWEGWLEVGVESNGSHHCLVQQVMQDWIPQTQRFLKQRMVGS